MSYTTQIKNEISKLYNTKSEMIAELSAFVRNNGNIVDNSIYLTTENEMILNRLVEFITALYDIHPKTDSKDIEVLVSFFHRIPHHLTICMPKFPHRSYPKSGETSDMTQKSTPMN